MTETPEITQSKEFGGGSVTLEVTSVSTGTANFRLKYGGETLFNDDYSQVFDKGDYPRQQRQTLRNRFQEALDEADGADAPPIADEIKEWLDGLKDDSPEFAIGPVAREIIAGTEIPVEIREAPDENTTWHVTLTFRGDARELEFDAGVMVGDGSGELANKIIHNFHERVEVSQEDWNEIADYWHTHSEVVDRTNVKANDEIAARVLSFISDRVESTHDRSKIETGPATAWVDIENDGGAVETDGPVVWVRDTLLTDELETAGKDVSYKGQLVQNLKKSGQLYDTPGQNTSKRPQSWTKGNSRPRVWAFSPEAVGVNPEASGEDTDNRAHSEQPA